LFHPSSCHGQAAQSITRRSSPVLACAGFTQKLLIGPSKTTKTSRPIQIFLFILSSPHSVDRTFYRTLVRVQGLQAPSWAKAPKRLPSAKSGRKIPGRQQDRFPLPQLKKQSFNISAFKYKANSSYCQVVFSLSSADNRINLQESSFNNLEMVRSCRLSLRRVQTEDAAGQSLRHLGHSSSSQAWDKACGEEHVQLSSTTCFYSYLNASTGSSFDALLAG